VSIAISSCWHDHRFQGRAVLPAVAAMQLLADWGRRLRPGLEVRCIRRARFEKFLELPESGAQIEVFCDLADLPAGGVRAELLTRSRSGKAGITRYKTHARADFTGAAGPPPPADPDPGAALAWAGFTVDPQRIYSELVPFGPAFRNIVQPLVLDPRGALAVIQAPARHPAGSLGASFVLDAAFHAACVWSQRFAGVVAFPVGVEERHVLEPTRPGGIYVSRLHPVDRTHGTLVFDLWIQDTGGRWFEQVRGVRMRDVSGGRLKPPAWIRGNGTGDLE
jgi:hypothetical protein